MKYIVQRACTIRGVRYPNAAILNEETISYLPKSTVEFWLSRRDIIIHEPPTSPEPAITEVREKPKPRRNKPKVVQDEVAVSMEADT